MYRSKPTNPTALRLPTLEMLAPLPAKPPVILWSRKDCLHSDRARETLRSNGIRFEERDINDPRYRTQAALEGIGSVPQFTVGKTRFIGMDAGYWLLSKGY